MRIQLALGLSAVFLCCGTAASLAQILPNASPRRSLFRRIPTRVTFAGASSAKATVAAGGASNEARAVGNVVAPAWGVVGVFYLLFNGLRRLVPIALEPFRRGDFGPGLWVAYAGSAALMLYAEGIKGFQKKFCPFVVRRAQLLRGSTNVLHCTLAPFFCMGLFHASKKRKIVSWSVLFGVFGIIQVVKRMAYPWNAIVDAGAVVGLGWGCISLAITYIRALSGQEPSVSAELPSKSEY